MPGLSFNKRGLPRLDGHLGRITVNGDRMGVFPNHIAALWTLRHSQATRDCNAFMILEDDVALPQGLKRYLDQTLWPESDRTIGAMMLFTHKYFANIAPGWHTWNPDVYYALWGAQALVFSGAAADAWLASPLHCLHHEVRNPALNAFADTELTKFSKVFKRPIWYIVGDGGASLVEHLGTESSVFGSGPGSMPGRDSKMFADRVIQSPTWNNNLAPKPEMNGHRKTAAKLVMESDEQRRKRRLLICEGDGTKARQGCVHWVDAEDAADRQIPQGCGACANPELKPTLINIGQIIGPRCKRGYWD